MLFLGGGSGGQAASITGRHQDPAARSPRSRPPAPRPRTPTPPSAASPTPAPASPSAAAPGFRFRAVDRRRTRRGDRQRLRGRRDVERPARRARADRPTPPPSTSPMRSRPRRPATSTSPTATPVVLLQIHDGILNARLPRQLQRRRERCRRRGGRAGRLGRVHDRPGDPHDPGRRRRHHDHLPTTRRRPARAAPSSPTRPDGTLYFGTGRLNPRVYRVESNGKLTPVIGTGSQTGSTAGSGSKATDTAIGRVSDIAVDGQGRLYVADESTGARLAGRTGRDGHDRRRRRADRPAHGPGRRGDRPQAPDGPRSASTFDDQDRLYVSNGADNLVFRVGADRGGLDHRRRTGEPTRSASPRSRRRSTIPAGWR